MMSDKQWKKTLDGIINTNNSDLEIYLTTREKIKKDRENDKRFEELEKTVSNLEFKLDLILEKLNG